MTPEGKALKEQCQWEAKAQWKGPPLKGDVEVSITLFFGTRRRADLDNFHKLSCDALSGIVTRMIADEAGERGAGVRQGAAED